MIGKISGLLDWRGSDQVLIDVRGVGYIVHVSERTLAGLPGVGEAVSLYTELMVREDLLQLFGFPTMLEKEWHKLLTTVQGVGAKAAMAILGTLGAEGTARAITLGDARAVQAAPGVGPMAQRTAASVFQTWRMDLLLRQAWTSSSTRSAVRRRASSRKAIRLPLRKKLRAARSACGAA